MTAREMFEELGYELWANLDEGIIYINFNTQSTVLFFTDSKCYQAVQYGSVKTVCVEEFNAIQKQFKELGWL